jgi:hypothetical protein
MSKFVYNKSAEPYLLRSPEMVRAMRVIAESAAAGARAAAPVGDGEPHYVDMIEAVAGGDAKYGALGRVNANKWTSHFIEFGTGPPAPTPPFAPLRTGAEAVGLHLVGGKE